MSGGKAGGEEWWRRGSEEFGSNRLVVGSNVSSKAVDTLQHI